jgi:hypothetical protein
MKTKMKLFVLGAALLGGIGLAAAQPAPGAAAQGPSKWSAKKAAMLAKYDTNKDGKLDEKERAVMRDEMLTARFEKMDLNKDGQISLEEFKKFSAEKAAKHQGRGGGFHRHHRGAKQGDAK